jgi:hypothetical protein
VGTSTSSNPERISSILPRVIAGIAARHREADANGFPPAVRADADTAKGVVQITMTADALRRFIAEQQSLGLRNSTLVVSNALYDELTTRWRQATGEGLATTTSPISPEAPTWGAATWGVDLFRHAEGAAKDQH